MSSTTPIIHAGSLDIDVVISSQPITWEVIASSSSQPTAGQIWAGHGCRKSCRQRPITSDPAAPPSVASNSTATGDAAPPGPAGAPRATPPAEAPRATPPPVMAWRSVKIYIEYKTATHAPASTPAPGFAP